MKNRIIITFSICLLVVMACKKMDSTYSKFVVKGGIRYTGKATAAKAYSGHNRIRLSWLKGADPNVVKAKILWNNNADSLIVPITGNMDTVSVTISNLAENFYSFKIITYDANGVPSIPVELLAGSYGDKYVAQLLNRPVNSALVDNQGSMTINWGNADLSSGALFTEVKYTDITGVESTKRFKATEVKSLLPGVKAGTKIQYKTIFKPDTTSIDEFFTSSAEVNDVSFAKTDWKILSYSTQHSDGDNAVINFIDGTDGTRWHTLVSSNYPHFIIIDLGVQRTITKFGVWRTTAFGGGDDRAPDEIQFFSSIDNVTWKDLGKFNFNRFINGEQQYAMDGQPQARYFKFVGLRGPQSYMSIGEISAYGF